MRAHLSRIPGLRRLPQAIGAVREDAILFESWRGQFSDNPRAISEEIHRRGLGYRHFWVIEPALAGPLPDWVEPVAARSPEHLALMGRARYLVANSTVLGFHHKRAGTTFLQTWHGVPLKRIGFDVTWDRSRRSRQAVGTLRRNVESWDMLIAPNRFSAPILRRAFRFEGEIAETGYPRTDMLAGDGADAIRAATRARLGIPDGVRVVLYAPTFRDSEPSAPAAAAERIGRMLGDDHLVLLRAHKTDAPRISQSAGWHARNVSRYPDNRELYLAADVLVTDYSSLMFDFAVTRKPILFHTPDLEHYRDQGRGFYFDFESDAPGPLLREADDVVAAVREIDAVAARHADGYERFVNRFCDLDDGRASERVVDLLLSR